MWTFYVFLEIGALHNDQLFPSGFSGLQILQIDQQLPNIYQLFQVFPIDILRDTLERVS